MTIMIMTLIMVYTKTLYINFAGMECKLKITTFNCQGFKFRNYSYVNEIFKQCNILMLQETWLNSFEHKNFIKEIPNCQYHAISGMDESDVSRVGRPKGGVAILWQKDLKLAFIPIVTNSTRLCALNIKSEKYDLILINVYMPNDDDTDDSYFMYGEIFSEISSILQTYENCKIIIGGDFNVDYERSNSRNLSLFKEFLELESLSCATFNILSNNFTRLGNLGEKSFIDHFIVSKDFKCNLDIKYDGHNLSDHMPVNMQTVICSDFVKDSNITSYRHDWDNVTDVKIRHYKQLLNQSFTNFVVPQNVLDCANFHCKDHNDIILKLIEDFMSLIAECTDSAIGIKLIGNSNKSGVMGWNDFIQPYKDKSIFWHNVWKSAGCPSTGQLAELRRFSRAKYHWAIKRTKYESNEYILNKTADQLITKSFDNFWSTIKSMKGSDRTIASVVDGYSTNNEIADRFGCIYKDLYNSIDDENFVNMIDHVDNLVHDKCSSGLCNSEHCHTINTVTVRKAIWKL